MKIVIVGPYPAPGRKVSGGIEAVIEALRPELAAKVDLAIVVPGAPADAVDHKDGCEIHYLAQGRGPGFLRYWTTDALRVARRVAQLRPDLVHLQGAAGSGLFVGVPKILTVHGILHEDVRFAARRRGWIGMAMAEVGARIAQVAERIATGRCDHIIVINPYVLEALPHIGRHQSTFIPNPLNRVFAAPAPDLDRPRAPVLVVAGKVTALKNSLGALDLLRAARQIDPRLRLVFCGDTSEPDYFRACQQFVTHHGLEAAVTFRGGLASAELAAEMDKAFGLLVLSNRENAPMVVAEAQARGLPVLAPARFGLKTMIAHGVTGFHLPAGPEVEGGVSREAQAQVLNDAMQVAWDRTTIRERALATYELTRVGHATIDLYRRCLEATCTASAKPHLDGART